MTSHYDNSVFNGDHADTTEDDEDVDVTEVECRHEGMIRLAEDRDDGDHDAWIVGPGVEVEQWE